MPRAALKPCGRPGCGKLTSGRFCSACDVEHKREAEKQRPSAAKRGYGRDWQGYSRSRLRRYPLCADPFGDHGARPVAATMTDHKVAHKGDMMLFWDKKNHQSLCGHCNSKKAAREEGGFGNSTSHTASAGS